MGKEVHQEVQREQDVGQEHSWYEIPKLAPRFRVVQPDAGNFPLAFQDDEIWVVAFPKQQEVGLQRTHEDWVVAYHYMPEYPALGLHSEEFGISQGNPGKSGNRVGRLWLQLHVP